MYRYIPVCVYFGGEILVNEKEKDHPQNNKRNPEKMEKRRRTPTVHRGQVVQRR